MATAAERNGGKVSTAGAMDDLMPTGEELLYEEEMLRNPYSLKHWWRYLTEKRDMKQSKRYVVYERALRALPGSYKLWKAYLDERRAALRNLSPTHPLYESLNNTYERALVSMHKMPRIWLDYLALLVEQRLVTRTRRAFDRALSALPITQHDRVWQLYLSFVTTDGVPEDTARRVYRRYLKLEPEHAEEYLAFLIGKGRWAEAAQKLAELVNDDTFRSLHGKSKHQMWLELCDMVTKHPNDVRGLHVESILRGGIRRYRDEVGRLWTSLADYFIQKGMFDKARDVYEEGLQSVATVRDFSLIFDALVQFEESLISAKMEREGESEPVAPEGDGEDFVLRDRGDDLDLRLARLERLMERRPELLSSVVLRQNPHNVHEWHKRVKLFPGDLARQIQTYTEAVRTVDIDKAEGKPHTLWCAFARFYETHGDLPNARVIFGKATQVPFKYVDDLAQVWCEWVEMELRHDNFTGALDVLRQGTTEPAGYREMQRQWQANPGSERPPPTMRVHRNLRLWNLMVDLEETLGTIDSTKAVYYRMMDGKIASPQTVLNFALYLLEHKYFEEAFRVYERGTQMFKFPYSRDLWVAYLQQFVARYGGSKLERARDAFESVLATAPAEERKRFFFMYADLEEKHGLARRAMDVYNRAVRAVPRKEKLEVLDVYISKSSSMFGIGKVREVMEMAIEAQGEEALLDDDCREVCRRYAALEQKLGEVDRARAIWIHGAAMADPSKHKAYWDEWNDFEVRHGNEDTFREMLRIKRSVAASFSSVHFNTTSIESMAQQLIEQATRRDDPMAALEAQQVPGATGTAVSGFRSAGVVNAGKPVQAGLSVPATANTEEIDIDGDGEGGEGPGEGAKRGRGVDIEQRAVPDAVLGSLAKKQRTE